MIADKAFCRLVLDPRSGYYAPGCRQMLIFPSWSSRWRAAPRRWLDVYPGDGHLLVLLYRCAPGERHFKLENRLMAGYC